MATPEGKVVSACIARINAEPRSRVVKVTTTQYSTTGGEPDLDACIRGRAVKIEVKAKGKKPTPRQYSVLRKWEAAGALAGYADSVEMLEEILNHLDDPAWLNPQLDRGHA